MKELDTLKIHFRLLVFLFIFLSIIVSVHNNAKQIQSERKSQLIIKDL